MLAVLYTKELFVLKLVFKAFSCEIVWEIQVG